MVSSLPSLAEIERRLMASLALLSLSRRQADTTRRLLKKSQEGVEMLIRSNIEMSLDSIARSEKSLLEAVKALAPERRRQVPPTVRKS